MQGIDGKRPQPCWCGMACDRLAVRAVDGAGGALEVNRAPRLGERGDTNEVCSQIRKHMDSAGLLRDTREWEFRSVGRSDVLLVGHPNRNWCRGGLKVWERGGCREVVSRTTGVENGEWVGGA